VTATLVPPVHSGRTREERARELVSPFREEYPFEPHFLDVGNGVHLHYVDEGPRDASPLLCVHGNPTWSFYFRRVVRELSGDRRVVAPDHVGCGLSDKPQDYPYVLERHVANLEKLVLELDLSEITLFLHDWGGAIGMGFARRHPDRVARLIVGNTAAFRSTAMPLRIAVCRWPVLGPLFVRGLGAFSRGALAMALERPVPASDPVRRGYLAPHRDWDDRVATLAFVRDIPMDEHHPSWKELVAIEESLASFRDRPMLILWGDRDWCFTPRFREEWQRRFPDATVRVAENAGHWVLEDAGDRARGWIADFLEES
jgi:haloalkane dehalogenase